MSDLAWVTNLEATARAADSLKYYLFQSDGCTAPNESCRAVWGPLFKEKIANCVYITHAEHIAANSPARVLALCRLIREMGEALKKYQHVPAPDLRNSVTQFSVAAEALEKLQLGPVTGEESGG